MNFENLLQRIMDSDINIRHSIITDTEGNILATNHREGITNFLSQYCPNTNPMIRFNPSRKP